MTTALQDLNFPLADPAATREALVGICRRYHIRNLRVFGSYANLTNSPESDLDLLVTFDPGHTPGFSYAHLESELAFIFGRRIDLHTRGSLSKYFREEVERTALTIYDAEE
jgi:predicted nucleotidyltransferase